MQHYFLGKIGLPVIVEHHWGLINTWTTDGGQIITGGVIKLSFFKVPLVALFA